MTDKPDPFKAAKDAATSGQRFSRGVMDSAQQIWLAGLGALSRTQQEGGKFFDALVEEGVRIQEKTHAYTHEQFQQVREQGAPWVEAARQRTNAAMGKLEQVFDERIARTLQHLDIPRQSELRALAKRVDELARALGEKRPRPTKPRAQTKPRPRPKA